MRRHLAVMLVMTAVIASAPGLAYAQTPVRNVAPADPKKDKGKATDFSDVKATATSDKVTASGLVTADGKPGAGLAIDVLIDGAKITTVQSGADGRFTLDVPSPAAGDHQLTLVFAGTDSLRASTAEGRITVPAKQVVPQTAAIQITSSTNTVEPGSSFTLSGTVTISPGNTPMALARLDITGGGTQTWAVTDDAGAFSVTLQAPRTPGTSSYSVVLGDVGAVKGMTTSVTLTIKPTPTPTTTSPTPTSTTTSATSTTSTTAAAAAPATPSKPGGPSIADLWPLALVGVIAVATLLALAAIASGRAGAARRAADSTLDELTDGEL